MKEVRPIVSVITITYNHEPFIAQTIEGVLMQQVNFPMEFIIAEDCSTDGTRAICQRYAEQYPKLIRLITSELNVGAVTNERRAISAARGKYIAFCEGDDYWTEPLKLQKQVDFLERHPDYSVCFHRYRIFDLVKNEERPDNCGYLFENENKEGIDITTEMFLSKWITQPLTMMYRRDLFDLKIAFQYKYYRDMHLIYHLIKVGKGYLFAFEGGQYNVTGYGLFSKMTVEQECLIAVNIYRELYIKNNDELLLYHYLKSLQWTIDKLFVQTHSKVKLYNFAFIKFRYSANYRSFFSNILKITFNYKK